MNILRSWQNCVLDNCDTRNIAASFSKFIFYYLFVTAAALCIFYCSLMTTSAPLRDDERETLDRTIALLAAKGFDREVFLLRHIATFRGTDNWLNTLADNENAFAATNFPFGVMTIYSDFYTKAKDDTERAMILLHEARHLQGATERDAYGYVWRNRWKLGWTILSHGTTESYITIELLTRENSPELFTCPANLWNDCTENLQARKESTAKIKTH